MTRPWIRRLGVATGLLVTILALGVGWLIGTPSGLRFALARTQAITHHALTVAHVTGRLVGPLTLAGLRYRDPTGLDVHARSLSLKLRLGALWRGQVHVERLAADGIDVVLGQSAPPSPKGKPFSLKPPLDIKLDEVTIGHVRIARAGQPVFASDTLQLAGAWTRSGLAIRRLVLRAPDGWVDLDGQLDTRTAYRGDAATRFHWRLGGIAYSGDIDAHGDGTHARAVARLTQPFAATIDLHLMQSAALPWRVTIAAPRFDATPLVGGGLSTLAITLQGTGDRYGALFRGHAELNAYRVDLAPLKLTFNPEYTHLGLEALTLQSPDIPGTLTARGHVDPTATPVAAELALNWNGVRIPAAVAGQALASTGRLAFQGGAHAYRLIVGADLGPPGQPGKLSLDIDGQPDGVRLRSMQITQARGRLAAHGTLTHQSAMGWDLNVMAEHFDPSPFMAGWPGSLNLDLSTDGLLTHGTPQVMLDLRQFSGTLRHRLVRGQGRLTLNPSAVLNGTLDLASGASTLHLNAQGATSNDARLTLAIASLGDWLPGASGHLQGDIAVKGRAPRLALTTAIHGDAMAASDQTIDRLTIDADAPDLSRPGGHLSAVATGMRIGHLAFDYLAVHADGTQAAHTLRIDATGHPLTAEVQLTGALGPNGWKGTLSTLNIDYAHLPRWHLQHTTALTYRNGAASIEDVCLTAGEPSLCVTARQDAARTLEGTYRMHQIPLALATIATEGMNRPIHADGLLAGDGTLRRTAAGVLSGHADLHSNHGVIAYADQPDRPLLVYDQLAANATLTPDRQRITVHSVLNDGGSVAAEISVNGTQQALAGTLAVHLPKLAPIEALAPPLANIKGRLDTDLRVSGTLVTPAITGQVAVSGFAAEVPSVGLTLTDGHASVRTTDATHVTLDGHVHSGDGTLDMTGTAVLGTNPGLHLGIQGSEFTAVDIPAAKAVLSPHLAITQDATGLQVSGKLAIDRADINAEHLPGAGATPASPDVTLADDPPRPPAASPASADIHVDLGQHVHLVGWGIDGHLSGQLDVRERPGQPATGQGQIGVDGTYRAYGHDMKIEHGRLLFASTPLANPGLTLRATRLLNPNATVDEGQKVGLEIVGTAQHPIITVFSNPVMEQSDALSYLVTGKPLSQAKGGDGNMVTAAAHALGSAAGDLLAKSVGAKIGVDDIGVASNDALGGNSAFTVGKYLSPRLYLSYGVGLFDPGQVITLRYLLSAHWTVQAQNATSFNQASAAYRLER